MDSYVTQISRISRKAASQGMLAAIGYAECTLPEANANGVMRYLRNSRNPRELKSYSA